MEESKREKLTEAGINVDVVLNRFRGNEKMLTYFLVTFYEDPNFGQFKTAMEEKRYKDAFKTLHTLKGLCGNLALDSLFEIIDKEVEFLRQEQYSEAEELLPEVIAEYDRVVKILATVE